MVHNSPQQGMRKKSLECFEKFRKLSIQWALKFLFGIKEGEIKGFKHGWGQN